MAEIEIEIDGRKLTAKPTQTVIQVADEAGIYIPRFCYHKQLSIPANCRMCLVEIEKAPKVLPACATPVMPGMKVFTRSRKTIAAQRAVMEFLLVNHPLDCPICDQGGECELQDLSMGYGSSWSHYDEPKRAVADQDFGPLIETEMTRCIYCTRCVRFGDEMAGLREIGAIGRGEFTEISTYIQYAMKSEVSGNIIDLCPVGALTSKPYRFTARAWELDQAPGISPHDCLGANLNVHTRYGTVLRVVTRENSEINETWLADRDRFSYTGLYHPERLEEPLAKINGIWQPVDWEQALYLAAKGMQEIAKRDATRLGALASPSSTVEEFYLIQKLMRALGSQHVDHRLREVDTRDQADFPVFPGLSMTLAELEACEAIILIGSNLQKEQPLAAMRVKKAAAKGAVIVAINPCDFRFSFALTSKTIVSPAKLPDALAAFNQSVRSNENKLAGKTNIGIVLGAVALQHPQASLIRYLAWELANITNAKLSFMTDGANTAGGWLAGAVPHRLPDGSQTSGGLSAHAMLQDPLDGYLLMNVEPELDCANAAQAVLALSQAKFVVALSIYRNQVLLDHANVILPMGPFTETGGTFVNAMGTWQSFQGVAKPYGGSRPGWKILRVLANFLDLADFEYENVDAIRQEVRVSAASSVTQTWKLTKPKNHTPHALGKLSRIGEIPLYAIDSLVRHALPLQQAQAIIEGEVASVRLHPETAKQLGIEEGSVVKVKQAAAVVELAVLLDARVATEAAWIAGGIPATRQLGELFGEVEISKV